MIFEYCKYVIHMLQKGSSNVMIVYIFSLMLQLVSFKFFLRVVASDFNCCNYLFQILLH
jgi:hypothetical protein